MHCIIILWVIIFPFIPGRFSFISNATHFFIHSLKRFILKKNAYGLLVFFNRVPYMQLSHIITGVNIIGRKVSVASVNGAGGCLGVFWGCSEITAGPQRKFLGSKEHLNWLKIKWMEVHILSVKAKSQAGNMWVKYIKTIWKGQSRKIFR